MVFNANDFSKVGKRMCKEQTGHAVLGFGYRMTRRKNKGNAPKR